MSPTEVRDVAPAESLELDHATRETVTRFVLREARLTDEHEYDAWFDLWADGEVRYWVPLEYRPGDEPTFEHNVILDDRAKLKERVFRLSHTAAHAQDPKSIVHRVVSPPEGLSREDGLIRITATFMLMEMRAGRQELHGGRSYFTLTDTSTPRIVEKVVVLTRRHDAVRNLTFLL